MTPEITKRTIDPTDFADLLFGVGSATSAGSALPAGSIHPSPEPLENDYPGDEDNGGVSSYYLFFMCGFFPYATTENYYLHRTRVEEIVFHLGNGHDLIVTGENIGGDNIYVQSAIWQGKPLYSCRLTQKEISEDGELHFVMGD